jgi:hypothetical protein
MAISSAKWIPMHRRKSEKADFTSLTGQNRGATKVVVDKKIVTYNIDIY